MLFRNKSNEIKLVVIPKIFCWESLVLGDPRLKISGVTSSVNLYIELTLAKPQPSLCLSASVAKKKEDNMDFDVPKEVEELRIKTREFVETVVMPHEKDYDYTIGRLPETVAQDLR